MDFFESLFYKIVTFLMNKSTGRRDNYLVVPSPLSINHAKIVHESYGHTLSLPFELEDVSFSMEKNLGIWPKINPQDCI